MFPQSFFFPSVLSSAHSVNLYWFAPFRFQNPRNFACAIRNPENIACRIRNPGLWNPEYRVQRIRKLTNDWNPQSKFQWQKLKSSSWNPESTAWSPESKTVLDSLTKGVCASLRNQSIIQLRAQRPLFSAVRRVSGYYSFPYTRRIPGKRGLH